MEKLYFYEEDAFFSKEEVSLLGRILDFLRKSYISMERFTISTETLWIFKEYSTF